MTNRQTARLTRTAQAGTLAGDEQIGEHDMSKQDGGPAYPCESMRDGKRIFVGKSGMTLRDHFAGQALCGLLPARDSTNRGAYTEMEPHEIARSAYEIADAMIAEHNRKGAK